MNSRAKLNRRDALKGIVGSSVAVSLAGCTTQMPRAPRGQLIANENTRPGTKDWMLHKTGIDPKTKYRCPWIEGYCSRPVLRAGDTQSFHVSTNPSSPFTIDIYRMGFYGGLGGRHMTTLGPFRGRTQPDPDIGPRRIRVCEWEPCATLRIPRDWLSGVYLGKLTAENDGWQSYVIFIVRDDRRADFIFQCSDTTWHAYNRWPSQFSLYDDGKKVWYWGPDVEVSFHRPYGKYCQILDAPLSTGSGEWFLWEFPIAYWLESLGYDITYISNLDTHADRAGLLRAKGFLSVGHDEYYSIEMFNNMRWAINHGLNVAFLSGNSVCGRVVLREHNQMEGRAPRARSSQGHWSIERVDRFGPRNPVEIKDFPEMARFPSNSPNENLLIGARSTPPVTGGADWTCVMPDHWLFEGTGMKHGDGIPGLVGWEWHGDPAQIPGLQILATGKTTNGSREGKFTATIYPGPKGNFVFNASSCWWGDGLSEPPGYVRPSVYTTPRGPDSRAQRITRNLLERMKASA